MRTTNAVALAILASTTFVSAAATAGEALYLTPPLFREQARETQRVRSVADLTTTPQPVAVAKPIKTSPIVAARAVRVVAEAGETAAAR